MHLTTHATDITRAATNHTADTTRIGRTVHEVPAANPWQAIGARTMHPSRRDPDEGPLVVAIATGLAASAAPWHVTDAAGPDFNARRELLLSTPRYDAWIIHVPAGGRLDVHDHGRHECAFAVVDGELEEWINDGVRTATRQVVAGQSSYLPAGCAHTIVNRSIVAATSIHVIAPVDATPTPS